MNSSRYSHRPHRGSILVGVVLVVVVLSILLASVLSYSTNTQRNSARQARVERAKLVAESEMEYLFYRWIAEINRGTASHDIATALVEDGYCATDTATDMTAFSDAISTDGWQISRTIEFYPIPGTSDGSAIGTKPGGRNVGRNYYFTARVRAHKTDPLFGELEYNAGRRFIRTETSILQNSLFYQGDLEIASGSNMTINGPISTNGNAYIGAQNGVDITITDQLRILGQFNGADDVLTGTTMRKPGAPGTSTLHAPVFDRDPTDGSLPDQPTARASQVEKLTSAENFVGGINPTEAVTKYPDAYRNSAGDPDVNEVYRSIIAPPPTDGGGALIPEDPAVKDRRMYNRAGIVITVSRDTDGNPVVNVGTPENITAYDSVVASHIDGIMPPDSRRKAVFDKRENKNIAITNLDVGAFKTALSNIPSMAGAYNGVLYIHDSTNAGDGNGIRLINGAETPNYLDASGQPKGFAVVTNNALYVQGNYNTKAIDDDDGTRTNPAALMGDAVTLLSHGWNDDNAQNVLYSETGDPDRAAHMDDNVDTTVNPDPQGLTINSAILTGNTPSTGVGAATPINSGGVQNLVRLMEDWYGYGTHIKGSLGQLFTSKFMNSPFKGSNELTADGDRVYGIPSNRELNFDFDLARRPPAWTPTTTEYHRGDFFTWQ